jgi:hypothetical protein
MCCWKALNCHDLLVGEEGIANKDGTFSQKV